MTEYFKELKNIMKELPKVFLYFFTIITFGLLSGFYPDKWKKIIREVDKALYE